MNFRRFLRPDCIRLELETRRDPPDGEEEEDAARTLRRVREEVIHELAGLLDLSGEISNPRRLGRDLHDREKRANTAIGQGIAIPHVRTLQAKSFVMAFGRSGEGLPFEAPDEEPVHLFFAMAAPPYDDRTYLRIYRNLATALLDPEIFDRFMETQDPNEILYILKGVEG